MSRYRDAWVLTVAVTTTVGIWAALMTWPLLEVLLGFVLLAVSAAGMYAAVQINSAPVSLGTSLAVGAAIGAGAIGAAGLALLIGGVAVLVVLGAAASCPVVVCWLQHLLLGGRHAPDAAQSPRATDTNPGRPPDSASPLAVADAEPPVDVTLDDAALCRAWRRSFGALHRARSLPELVHVVNARQAYLDELERRNPTGLAAWLASGPHAASDPSRYIRQPHGSEPPSAT